MQKTIIRETDFQKARRKIRESKEKEIIFSSNNDELNRKILEKLPVNVLLINQSGRKDRMKQRDSGFNHIMARLAKKNNVAIGINLDEIIDAKTSKEKSQILARVRQNIKLCNKNKIKMKFVTRFKEKNSYNLKSLGLVLGMPTWMIKNIAT